MNFKSDEFFGRHPDVLAQETEFVELSSFFLPEGLDQNQLGAARMIIRHSFRSGFTLGDEIDSSEVVDSVIDLLTVYHDLSEDEQNVTISYPEVLDIATLAYDQGAQLKNG